MNVLALIVGLACVPFCDPVTSHWLRVRWRARTMLPAIEESKRQERGRKSDEKLSRLYRELTELEAKASPPELRGNRRRILD